MGAWQVDLGRGESTTHQAHEPAGRVGGLGVGRTDRRALTERGLLTSDGFGARYAAHDADAWGHGAPPVSSEG
jgi:hypothetical protein